MDSTIIYAFVKRACFDSLIDNRYGFLFFLHPPLLTPQVLPVLLLVVVLIILLHTG